MINRLTDDVVDAIVSGVREAARLFIMPRFGRLDHSHISTKSGPTDLVTQADKDAEEAISSAIKSILPAALVIGEEMISLDSSLLSCLDSTELVVVIDPIDGTFNFASGVPLFGVILAVIYKGETIFGLLYDPVMDDWIFARRGEGAQYCRPGEPNRRLPAAKPVSMSFSCGYVPLSLYTPSKQSAILSLSFRVRRLTSLHCSCHEYRQLALGHAQFLLSPAAKLWDHAAGVMIVQECGGAAFTGGDVDYCPTGGNLQPLSVIACSSDRAWLSGQNLETQMERNVR